MSTVLVTGASGLLGRQVLRTFQLDSWNAVGTALNRPGPPTIVKLDLTVEGAIERILDDIKPTAVIHCAANRFPDSCSADPESAHKLNVAATRALASATASRGIFLIYISTDYVFSGRPGEAPYNTSATPDPPNVYGQTKLDGEKAVLEVTSQSKSATSARRVPSVVLRVPILYGRADEPSESAVNTLVSLVWESQKIKSAEAKIKIDDYAQRFPTNTEDVARVCRDICKLYIGPQAADRDLPQVLHFSSEDKMTKWDMCKIFSEILTLPIDGLVPFKPEETPDDSVKRPYDCHLDTSVLKDLGIDVHTADFRSWWRRELGAFRH